MRHRKMWALLFTFQDQISCFVIVWCCWAWGIFHTDLIHICSVLHSFCFITEVYICIMMQDIHNNIQLCLNILLQAPTLQDSSCRISQQTLMHHLTTQLVNSLSDNTVWKLGCSCATSDPDSIRMGDCLWTGKPSRYVTSQLGWLSLLPSVGR